MSTDNLGFGCVSLTSYSFVKDAENILSTAFNGGIKHFDTAPLYGNGYSEKILGKFIKDKRDKVTITTKCGLGNLHQPGININIALLVNSLKRKFRKEILSNSIEQPTPLNFRSIYLDYVQRSLSNSLKNLQTDYIDYYFLHEALPVFLTDEALSFLINRKQEGVIRNLGIAAAYVNLLPLDHEAVKEFSILQYENGPHYNTHQLLLQFKDKNHFFHSTLKSLRYLKSPYSKSELAGILLNRACKINLSGKILFSTIKQHSLINNLEAFEKYKNSSLEELNRIIDAIH